MKALMQSGAGMLLSHPGPSMSYSARRIVNLSRYRARLLADPVQFEFELHLEQITQDLRSYASEYIALACQDLDAQAELSKAIAAGRRFGGGPACGGGAKPVSGGLTC